MIQYGVASASAKASAYFLLNYSPKYMVMMKKIRLNVLLLTAVLFAGLYSCTKTAADFDGQGGLLPTHYITINDSSFSPIVLTLATGSSITFVNSTDNEHSIVSDDSATILSGTILHKTSFYFKKDTTGTFNYHCGMHPTVKGTIILTP